VDAVGENGRFLICGVDVVNQGLGFGAADLEHYRVDLMSSDELQLIQMRLSGGKIRGLSFRA